MTDNSDMPGYQQYPGACGLTSLLMALKPDTRQMDTIFKNIWEKIKYIFGNKPDRENGFNWQRVLEWLLFQIPRNEKLKKILEEGFGTHFSDEMLPILEYRLEKSHRYKSTTSEDLHKFDEINKGWLMDRVYVWKMDFELEMLAYLFGCNFLPWEKTEDGTGAIFFNTSEIMSENPIFSEKINLMISSLEKGGPVLCCASIHWLAIKGITKIDGVKGKYLVKYNDPASGRENSRFLDSYSTSERFYLFEFSKDLLIKNSEILNSL